MSAVLHGVVGLPQGSENGTIILHTDRPTQDELNGWERMVGQHEHVSMRTVPVL